MLENSNLDSEPTKDLSEIREKIAEATGEFYDNFLTLALQAKEKTGEEITSLEQQYLDKLPPHVKSLYQKGIDQIKQALEINHQTISHDGNEGEHLISAIMKESPLSDEKRQQILSELKGKMYFYESFPGVFVLQVEHEAYYLLQDNGLIPGGSSAVALLSHDPKDPTFFVFRRMRMEESIHQEISNLAQNGDTRHEFHHVLWHFLRQAGFVRPAQENTPELSRAFERFRDETVAYTVQKRQLTDADASALVYTEDKDIRLQAYKSRNICSFIIEFAKRSGEALQNYYFPAMAATTFSEIEQNYIEAFSIQSNPGPTELDILFDIWNNSPFTVTIRKTLENGSKEFGSLITASESLQDLLQRKNIHVSVENFFAFAKPILAKLEVHSLEHLKRILNDISSFGEAVAVDLSEWKANANTLLKTRLPLPEATQSVLLEASEKNKFSVALDLDPHEFVQKTINIWHIDNPETFEVYSKIIRSAPEMKQALLEQQAQMKKKGIEELSRELHSAPDLDLIILEKSVKFDELIEITKNN